MSSTVSQVVDGGLRSAPPITVSAASFMGLGLDEWMYIATIAYTVLQGAYLLYKWRRTHKKDKEAKEKDGFKQDNRE